MTIEGAPDAATLANVIGALTARRSLAMIAFPSGARVWLATGHTDMRKGFGSLALHGAGGVQARSRTPAICGSSAGAEAT